MKTKEEILKSKLPDAFQYGWFGSNPKIEWGKALEAMEEYAKAYHEERIKLQDSDRK